MKQSIQDVEEVLGAPLTRTILTSVDEPFLLRAGWPCGCVLDYVDESGGAYNWYACPKHTDPAHNEQSVPGFLAGGV